ncbi:MAG TPA: energy-coupling factor transporter ATPase [Desulfotignum sp.]|nr:energy-coupling factor transporter ATPase [Desulfotignum sp.]
MGQISADSHTTSVYTGTAVSRSHGADSKPGAANPLFCVHRLGYAYPDGITALSGVDLEIFSGDRTALVGPNGSGKTTLIKLLSGLLAPEQGHILYQGRPLTKNHLEESRLTMGVLFQDPDDQLFGHTVIDDAAFGPRSQGKSREAAVQCARQALHQVNLEHLAYKEPHNLSYGQKKRAALAGILAMQPDVLILDEPTANLDPGQEAVFLDLLKAFDGTLICISHDLIFLYELCEKAVVLHHGSIHHNYTMRELVSRRSALRDHGLDFSFRMAIPANGVSVHEENEITGRENPSDASAGKPGYVSGHPPLVRLEKYGYVYPDGTPGLQDFSLDIHEGEKTAIVGENGAGKSTLLACLCGLRRGQGALYFKGTPVTKKQYKDLWRRAGLVFQDCADQLFCASVEEEMLFGLRRLGLSSDQCRHRAADALARVGLAGFENRVPLHLSGGERKRLALGCVLAMEPDLLILDEPTAGLDPRGEEQLMAILETFDKTLLLVSHDMFFIEKLTQRTLVMHQGRVIRDLPTPDFMQDDKLCSLNGLSFSYRQRTTTAIQKLQHEHEHRHPHLHIHEHPHRHGRTVHTHPHEHLHDHAHRFVHTHPGGESTHDHAQRLLHDHGHPGHEAEPHDHPHE